MSDYSKKAQELFCSGYNCAQAIVLAFKDLYDVDEITLKKLSSSSIFILCCSIVSLSLIVTVPLLIVSSSIVIQNGVPIASCLL